MPSLRPTSLSKALRLPLSMSRQTIYSTSIRRVVAFRPPIAKCTQFYSTHHFSTFTALQKGLSPESENPTPKEPAPATSEPAPADISIESYHELSDEYMNALVEKLEQLQEETEEVDVEYTAGVLTLSFPPAGTYVINKQPPNKQIWLSSPTTGPKRYDYVMFSEGQDAKEGTGKGEWVYLRDGSTLTDLLQKEIGVDMSELYAPVPHRGD